MKSILLLFCIGVSSSALVTAQNTQTTNSATVKVKSYKPHLKIDSAATFTRSKALNTPINQMLSKAQKETKTNPSAAMDDYRKAAATGHPAALYALGAAYQHGKIVTRNNDSALIWLTKAANAGYTKAYWNLGNIYRTARGATPQDFQKAVGYFKTGASKNNYNCITGLGYMYYKGLGVKQNYDSSFILFHQAAVKNFKDAEYFLGVSFKNGYGVTANADSAKHWLQLAANIQSKNAKNELKRLSSLENKSLTTNSLQSKAELLASYNDGAVSAAGTDIGGVYKGYMVYYDFSHKYVFQILPVSVTLAKNGTTYKGTWKEGRIPETNISGSFQNGLFVFDSSSHYVRHNHYSNNKADKYLFKQANLSLKNLGDSTYLSGDIQFYGINRREPGQPTYLTLTKQTGSSNTNNFNLSVAPNPTSNGIVKTSFTLTSAENVRLEVYSKMGDLIQRVDLGTLAVGTHQYQFNLQTQPTGVYILKLITNTQVANQKIIKQ